MYLQKSSIIFSPEYGFCKGVLNMSRFLSFMLTTLIGISYLGASVFEKTNPVDQKLPVNRILYALWNQHDIAVPAPVSDAAFLRRATLTLAGRLPSADEVRNFVNSDENNKYDLLIDKLLVSDDYADMQAMRFADMLRIKSEFPINLWPNAVQFYHRTVRDDLKRDRPLNELFYELLTASGSNFRNAYANFFRASADRSPIGLAKMVLLTTMNMRESSFSAGELEKFARLFSCIRYKSTYEWKEEIVFNAVEPAEFTAMLPDGSTVQVNSAQTDPRKVFADWLLKTDNDYFARAMVNKVWYWVFGRGIYPVADNLPEIAEKSFWNIFSQPMASDNVPFSEELQNCLISEFKKSNYSLRALYKLILQTASFRASSRLQSEENLQYFAVYPVRRMESELLIDALAFITKGYDRYMSVIPEPFTYLPWDTKAINIADGSISTGVLDSFGRPPRDSGQISERNTASSDSQGLYLMNSAALYRRIQNYCKRQQGKYRYESERLDRIYMDILSRYPTERERKAFSKYALDLEPKVRFLAWIDTVWVLLNSKEFIFYH